MTNISSQTSHKEVLFSVYENVSYYESTTETEDDSESQPASKPATKPASKPASQPATQLPLNPIDVNFPTRNCIKNAIENNSCIEDFLHVIAVISNPCNYLKRVKLMKEFILRMEQENNVILYIVEMVYGNQKFTIAQPNNKNHLQIRTEVPVWHKENMINVGVKHLLPENWKAFAWIDADIEFENNDWAADTLKVLNGCRDIVQLFSHCVDMNENKETMNVYNSLGFQYEKKLPYSLKHPNYWHPGYAWACTRTAYEKMGGLFDKAILGSGDHIMAHCIMNKAYRVLNSKFTKEYNEEIIKYQKNIKRLRLGYIPGVIQHNFHGAKVNRKYIERNTIIYKYNYNPLLHLSYDPSGVIIPSKHFPKGFKDDILNYFSERNEDE